MTGVQSPQEADVGEISTRLNEGLENCRAVVENYRTALEATRIRSAKLTGPGDESPPESTGANDL